MTRRLQPPVLLRVTCDAAGTPRVVCHAGYTRGVIHVGSRWVRPAQWWRDGASVHEALRYRLVMDGSLIG